MRSIKTKLFSLAMAFPWCWCWLQRHVPRRPPSAPSAGSRSLQDLPPAQYNRNTASNVAKLATGETASDVKAVLKATCTGTIKG